MTRSTPFPFGNRWAVAWTLLAATTLNFLDRQTLAVIAPQVQQDLGISSIGYAAVINSFLTVYAVMYLLSGRIVDFLGTRRGLGFAIIWWSIAQLLHAFAHDLVSLCVLRALLAVGEAAIIPSCVKAVAEWFEPRERSTAVCIFEAGLSIGPILAQPLVAWIALHQGWRSAFLYTGGAGFVMAAWWLLRYATPAAAVAAARAAPTAGGAWRHLIASRAIWGVAVTRIFGDPVWHFYMGWLPKYFAEAKGLKLAESAAYLWIPFFAQMLGGLFGAWLAHRMIRHGAPPVAALYRIMLLSTPIISIGVLTIYAESLWLGILAVSVGGFALQVWGVSVETLPAEIFPAERVAAGVGLCGMLGTLGGVAFTAVTGYLVQHYSYTPVWFLSAVLCPVGWFVGWLLLRRNAPGAPASGTAVAARS
jgi:ACS family hexuronate transporter-like MFS transporter